MAMTTVMARDLSAMGVPDAIIGRLIRTPHGEMAWLTEAELNSVGAVRLEGKPATRSQVATSSSASTATTAQTDTVTRSSRTGAPPADEISIEFQQGAFDRRSWEGRFMSLISGKYREGAEFWTYERSKKIPRTCASAEPQYELGCSHAKGILDGSDKRRKAEPQYWWGWNSYQATASAPENQSNGGSPTRRY